MKMQQQRAKSDRIITFHDIALQMNILHKFLSKGVMSLTHPPEGVALLLKT